MRPLTKLLLYVLTLSLASPLLAQKPTITLIPFTGEIIYLNSSGPGQLTFGDTTTTIYVHGPSLWNVPPPPLEVTEAAGLPPAPYIHGNVTVVLDANGNVVSMTDFHGTATSVCDLFK